MPPKCPSCGDPNQWQAGSMTANVICGNCGHVATALWYVSNAPPAPAKMTANTFSSHNWDYATSVAICTRCLVDANNPGHQVPCPMSPMDWPAGGSTAYPNCSCGINDWTILNTGTFMCNQCQRLCTLPQLQALAPFGRAALRKLAGGVVQITLPGTPTVGTWNSWAGGKFLDDEDMAVPVKPTPPTYEQCTACKRSLSKEMDAYYGKDPREAKKCRPCRTGKPF